MIYLETPLTVDKIKQLKAGDEVFLSGTIYTGRDAAHKRLIQLLDEGKELPFNIQDQTIFYVGPTPSKPGQVFGSGGPTTSGRMDAYSPRLIKLGLHAMIGKGYRSDAVKKAIVDYHGAFVDIGGAQGLLHISEMTWGRNQNPRDILEVGQSIEVSVKELDKENKRFKLSYEKKGPNPWNKVEEKYHVGDVVKVKISKIMPFGAFAELEKGIEGLIHISQICERKIAKPEEELQVGQKVNAKIISIDFENKKIELSIRELEGTSQEYKENA